MAQAKDNKKARTTLKPVQYASSYGSSRACNVRRVYNDRMAFRRQWNATHLCPAAAAKQASTHVAYQASVSFSTAVSVIVSIRQVIVATIVRHCDVRTAPCRLGSS
jgi:hypothetical protein